MIRVAIADDHDLIRDGFRKLVSTEPDLTLVGEAKSAEQLIYLCESTTIDVLVLDLGLPDKDGLEVLKDIRVRYTHVKVLILSMHPEDRYAQRAMQNGACGYLTKDSASDVLIIAIRKIYNSGRYITPKLAEKIVDNNYNSNHDHPHENLSDREFQVLLLLGKGHKVSEISKSLSLSINTVHSYRRRLMLKMKLHSSADCIRYVMEHNLDN